MQDLTTGSITRHLLKTTSFMLVAIVFQTLYYLVDLYWVGRLGTQAVAAVGIAGNLTFIVLALSQMIGVGATAVVSHAFGRKDPPEAIRLFNQAQVLGVVTGALFLVLGMMVRMPYVRAMSADAETARLAAGYLLWFIPAMALQFLLVAMSASLRAIGNFKTGMQIGSGTVILNMVLAPFLIFGWGTGIALGVAGAAISSLVAVVVADVWLALYYLRPDTLLRFDPSAWKPHPSTWRRMLGIGLPSGFEFAMTTVYLAAIYTIARPFGASAQAGFGIGQRIVQASMMPVVALGFATAPVAGQNFGARNGERVKATFKDAALLGAISTALITLVLVVFATAFTKAFSHDPAVLAVSVEYIRIIAVNGVGFGVIFVMSSMFQAMGNTVPSLVTSSIRLLVGVIPALWLSHTAGFQLRWVWYLSVASVYVQLVIGLWLLRREFATRLSWPASSHSEVAAVSSTT